MDNTNYIANAGNIVNQEKEKVPRSKSFTIRRPKFFSRKNRKSEKSKQSSKSRSRSRSASRKRLPKNFEAPVFYDENEKDVKLISAGKAQHLTSAYEISQIKNLPSVTNNHNNNVCSPYFTQPGPPSTSNSFNDVLEEISSNHGSYYCNNNNQNHTCRIFKTVYVEFEKSWQFSEFM